MRNRFKGLDLIDRVPEELWTEILDFAQEEVINRFKVLDLIDRVPEELWMEVRDTVQEAGIKTIPKKKKCKKKKEMQKGKMVV